MSMCLIFCKSERGAQYPGLSPSLLCSKVASCKARPGPRENWEVRSLMKRFACKEERRSPLRGRPSSSSPPGSWE